jgi:small subunit ribosomal protein S6
MAFYESVFIARQDLSTQQVEALTEQMTGVLTGNGAKVAKTEQWGLRSLAYRIKKNRKGHYTQLTIDGPAAAVQELERQLGLHEDVLRSLTLRIDEIDMEPSAILQAKNGRDERPRRGDRDDRPRHDDRPRRDDRPAPAAPAATEEKGAE